MQATLASPRPPALPTEAPRSPAALRHAARAALFAIGVALSLAYGRRGYMPLDQSIVFDGGWRLLSGQVPFRDFHAPNGFVPHLIQAGFFAVLGVNWFAYCLHAAVVNGLFAVVAFEVLFFAGSKPAHAFFYAALSALVLYPPFGVPYMDQHAFFFSLLAVAVALAARTSARERARRWLFFALPWVFALAYLSKQIPSVFVFPVALAIALWPGPGFVRRLALVAAGALAVACALALVLALLEVDLARLDYYFRELPAQEGGRRIDKYVPNLREASQRMGRTEERFGLWAIALVRVPGPALAFVFGLAAWAARRRAPEVGRALLRSAGLALFAVALLFVCFGFIALTSNQAEIGMPYVFVSLALIDLAIRGGAGAAIQLGARGGRYAGSVLALGFACVAAHDAWRFNEDVNETRTVNDIAWDPSIAERAAADLPEGLEFLRWQVPERMVKYTPADLRGLIAYLRSRPENVLLVSDASIVYGLAGKRSMAPSLWFHPKLTIPPPESPWFGDYEDELIEKLEREDLRLVVLEGEKTWIGRKLSDWPRFEALVLARTRGEVNFGPFRVLELGP